MAEPTSTASRVFFTRQKRRAVWGALPNNPVMAARYQHLTTRERNQLNDGQARAAIAAALLRWIHVIVTRRVTWDAALAGANELPAAA